MRKLSPKELEYLKSTICEIELLEAMQTNRYNLMLITLGLEDSDELFDACFNGSEIKENA